MVVNPGWWMLVVPVIQITSAERSLPSPEPLPASCNAWLGRLAVMQGCWVRAWGAVVWVPIGVAGLRAGAAGRLVGNGGQCWRRHKLRGRCAGD